MIPIQYIFVTFSEYVQSCTVHVVHSHGSADGTHSGSQQATYNVYI